MKTSFLLFSLLVSLLLTNSVVATTSNTLRGTPSGDNEDSLLEFVENAFACTLAAADKSGCTDSADDDGNACVWCNVASSSSGGLCVSSEQGREISNVVPQVQCTTTLVQEKEDTSTMTVPSDFWECLMHIQQQDCTCTWCNTESGVGVCLADAAAKAVQDCDFFDCNPASSSDTDSSTTTTTTLHDSLSSWNTNPIDVNCLAAGMGSDDAQSVCDETLDANGNVCVWCDVAASGYGLCLSADAAAKAGNYLTCDNVTTKEEAANATPDDNDFVECLSHTTEDDCHNSNSQDETCTWCNTLAGFGMCFSEQAMKVAKMYEPLFHCDIKTTVESSSPWDPTCLAVVFQGGDKETCETTQDQQGNACVWCDGNSSTGGQGMCLTSDQASMASQWLTCDENELELFVESPTDPTCFAAAFQANDAEATCHETNDQDGTPCVWCAGPSSNMGVCLSSDQASIASQWLTCEDPNMNSPLDPTCLEAGLQGDEDTCHATQDEDGNACVWCQGDASTGNVGVCLSLEQASMALQWLTCDDYEMVDVEMS